MAKHWDEGYTCLLNSFGNDIKNDTYYRIMTKILTFHYNDDKELSLTYLQKITNKSRNAVRSALKSLQELGYIKNTKKYCSKTNSPAIYKISKKCIKSKESTTQPGTCEAPPPGTSEVPKEVNRKRIKYNHEQINAKKCKNSNKSKIVVDDFLKIRSKELRDVKKVLNRNNRDPLDAKHYITFFKENPMVINPRGKEGNLIKSIPGVMEKDFNSDLRIYEFRFNEWKYQKQKQQYKHEANNLDFNFKGITENRSEILIHPSMEINTSIKTSENIADYPKLTERELLEFNNSLQRALA